MARFKALFQRELAAFFNTFSGYATLVVVFLALGGGFVALVEALNGLEMDIPFTQAFYDSFYFWFILLFSVPVLTMRSFAADMESGNFDITCASPAGDWAVVLSKYLSCMVIYLALWTPLIVCRIALVELSVEVPELDVFHAVSTGLGVLLIGGLYVALGTLVSAVSQSSIIAAMVTLGIGIALFSSGFIVEQASLGPAWGTDLARVMAISDHMRDFARGVIDTRSLVFYISSIALALFLTFKRVEARRWK